MDDTNKPTLHPRIEAERVVLRNGIVLLLSPNHSLPAVSIHGAVLAGSRDEIDAKAGLASLVGELISEGTTTRTGRELAEAIESTGGRLITFGEYQTSGAHGSFLSKDLDLAIGATSDMLMNAIFPEEKVRQFIERRTAQIRSRLDIPRIQASDALNEIVFEGHPQHRPPVGYEQSVARLVRQDFVDYYKTFYSPDNLILAICGDIDVASLVESADRAFAAWQRREGGIPRTELVPLRRRPAVRKFVNASKEQVNIFLGHLGVDRKDPDYYTLLVLDTILGSSPGFTSRIPRILRDQQGLAYSTFSNITSSAGLDAGRFVAYIGTSPENLEKGLAGLRQEIERIVREPVTEEELEGAKAYLTGNFVFDFQTNTQIAQFLIEAEMYGLGFDYPQKYPNLIRAVTIEDVAKAAQAHIDPERLVTVVVGPVNYQV
jgi:zinc protease